MCSMQDEESSKEMQKDSKVCEAIADDKKEACVEASTRLGDGCCTPTAYADADPEEQRAMLIFSIKMAYPILDKCMCEAAVDMFLKYPDLAPDEILKDVSPSYFLDNIPVVKVPEQPELEEGQVSAGVTPQFDASAEGHTIHGGETHPASTSE